MRLASPRTGLSLAADRVVTHLARALWQPVKSLSQRFAKAPVRPRWAPAPLVRTAQNTVPPRGWPRQTTSLCPECVRRLRRDVRCGRLSLSELANGRPAEIAATIMERDGCVIMVKRCPEHGLFEDLLSIDPAFLDRIEQLFPGRDYEARAGELRRHGTSSIKYGRGAVLTVDLTTRCNLHCDVCFMAASRDDTTQDLTWSEIEQILNAFPQVQPRRQLSVQFSGGEPTLSPHFFDAIRHARKLGYFCVQCASNGIRFAADAEFCRQAKEAGLRVCYLQFDGVTEPAHEPRHEAKLFATKQRAIDNLHAAGIDVVLVPTVINGHNSDQVGRIVEFAAENADRITVVSFQPVSFSGRWEDVSDEQRNKRRYTLSHLAHDLHAQLGVTEPLRDWFPLGAMNPFSDLVDLLLGPDAAFGALKCGCHPHCGVGTVLLVHKRTRQVVPVCDFLNVEQLLADLRAITDAGHGRGLTLAQVVLALFRNLRPDRLPAGYGPRELLRQLVSQVGASGARIGESEGDAKGFEWRFLFVAGMWFQDLYNYDFRRTEMCIIPYGTELGEISFCAYNTGIGWRQYVEDMRRQRLLSRNAARSGRVCAGGGQAGLQPFEGARGAAHRPDFPRKRLPVLG
jgi:uncharacterized radical SAM superfamily Fe-S cluster-containing enzyme